MTEPQKMEAQVVLVVLERPQERARLVAQTEPAVPGRLLHRA